MDDERESTAWLLRVHLERHQCQDWPTGWVHCSCGWTVREYDEAHRIHLADALTAALYAGL